MSTKGLTVLTSLQRQRDKLKLIEKYGQKGKLEKILINRGRLNEQLDKVLMNQMNKIRFNESDYYKERSKVKFNLATNSNIGHHTAKLRANYLSNILCEYLQDSLESGVIGVELSEVCKLQISKITLESDMRALEINWLSFKNEDVNKKIEDYLPKLANEIRYNLSANRVIGYVPPVKFIRDDSRVVIEKLDDILIDLNKKFREEEEQNDQTNKTNDEQKVRKDKDDNDQLKLVSDLYGVDHEKLSKQITDDGGGDSLAKSVEKELSDKNKSLVDVDQQLLYNKSLKALKLNQVLKKERRSKNAMLILAHKEFDVYKKSEEERINKLNDDNDD